MKSYRKLKKENRDLRERLKKYEPEETEENTGKSLAELQFTRIIGSYKAHSKNSWFYYIRHTLKASNSYKAYSRVNSFFKPFLFAYRFLRILFLAFAWIQASALLLVLFLVLLVLLPVALAALFFFSLVARINMNYKMPTLRHNIKDKDVLIFFRRGAVSKFFFDNICDLSRRYTVIVVIPYPVRIANKRVPPFLNCRFLSSNAILAYEHSYFYFRRALLKNARTVKYIY